MGNGLDMNFKGNCKEISQMAPEEMLFFYCSFLDPNYLSFSYQLFIKRNTICTRYKISLTPFKS